MKLSLRRTRMLLGGIAMGVLALFAGRVFDEVMPALLVPALLPTVVGLALLKRSPTVRLIGAVASIVAGVAAAVLLSGGGLSDFGAAFGGATNRLLSTDWPSPDRADLVGVIGLLLAVAGAITAETAGRRRFHLLPLFPVLTVYVILIALSSPLGMGPWWLLTVSSLCLVFAALRSDERIESGGLQSISTSGEGADAAHQEATPAAAERPDLLSDRVARLRGERRILPVIVLVGLAAAMVSAPISFAHRADPRRNDPADRTAALVDPVESTLALRAIDPPIPLHEVSNLSTASVPERWRTTALETYDGLRWTPALTLRPIGRRLGPEQQNTIDFDLRILDESTSLLPLPGDPIIIDGHPGQSVETDDDRTVVHLVERARPDDVLSITTAQPVRSLDAVAQGPIAPRPVDEEVSALTTFARTIAGDGTLVEQLRQIESTMRSDYVLAPDAPGAGQQRALIERFVRETQRGTAEQFASGYVLLARSLGVDARVATGFRIEPPTAAPDGSLTITSAEAAVWPEVRLASGAWVAMDPVPEEATSDVTPPPQEPAVQTPAAAQPPIAIPPDASDTTESDVDVDDNGPITTTAALTRLVRRVVLIGGLGVLPILLAVLTIIGIKYVRRRRRLRAAAAEDRVRGAWSVATDRLVDAGLSIAGSDTDGDIASAGLGMVSSSRSELRRLAALSSAVTFGAPHDPERFAEESVACLRTVEQSMASERTWRQQAQWRLSLRSLRRSTRSPVH